MTNEKLLEVVEIYRQKLHATVALPYRWPDQVVPAYYQEAPLAHVKWCLDQIHEFVLAGRKEKAMRWLGFVQGALWAYGLCSIHDLMKHVMPEGTFNPSA